MAQHIAFAPGPADVPGPRPTIVTTPAGESSAQTATTTDIQSPTVTNRALIAAHSDSSSSAASLLTLVRTYALEAAPAATATTLTALGWAQHYTTHPGLEAFGFTALAVGAGAAAGHGLKHKHDHLFAGSAGITVALADVAAATAFGPSPASLTVSAISVALGYAALVPWLIRHRKDQKKMQPALRTPATAPAPVAQPDDQPPTAPEVNNDEILNLLGSLPLAPRRSPFYDQVIPYADEDSDDVSDPIRIGWNEYGQPVPLTMLYRHTLVAGASDFGKSGIVNLIIKKLLKKKEQDRELFGIDMKPGAPELGPWEPKMRRLARTPEQARDLLQYVRAECDRRGAFLADLSASSMAAGRGPVRKWIPGVHGPAWWIVTDELAELIRQDEELRKQEAAIRKYSEDPEPAEPEIATTYESLLAIARFLGIQFVSATQQPSAKVFGGNTDARGNYANRISTRVGEAGHTPFIFGSGCRAKGWKPEDLTRAGEFYLGAPEMPLVDPPKCRAEYVTDEDIAADVSHFFQAGVREPSTVVSEPRMRLVRPALVEDAVPKVLFPDGSEVRRAGEGWLELYRVFLELCAEQGHATKDDLVARGPYDSRDTVRRATEMWLTRGVLVRRQGRADLFHLPDAEGETTCEIDDAEGAN